MVQQVVTIAGLKGGTGKTSTAVNLAAFWSASRSTLLIDADPNGSASKWHQRSEGGLGRCVPIQQAPMAMAQSWEVVVMDTAGGSRDEQRTYAEGSAFVLAPCPPAASSIEQVIDLGGAVATGPSPLCRGADDGGSAPSTGCEQGPRATRAPGDTGTEHPNQPAVGLA